MPEQDSGAGEIQHRDEVVNVAFPAADETPEVMKPSREVFDLPAPSGAAQTAPVLDEVTTATAMRHDHLDAVGLHQDCVERVAGIPAIADQAGREVREEAGVEGGGDEVRLIR
jgi:hypothetical protein